MGAMGLGERKLFHVTRYSFLSSSGKTFAYLQKLDLFCVGNGLECERCERSRIGEILNKHPKEFAWGIIRTLRTIFQLTGIIMRFYQQRQAKNRQRPELINHALGRGTGRRGRY